MCFFFPAPRLGRDASVASRQCFSAVGAEFSARFGTFSWEGGGAFPGNWGNRQATGIFSGNVPPIRRCDPLFGGGRCFLPHCAAPRVGGSARLRPAAVDTS